jgi:hypothetical protein
MQNNNVLDSVIPSDFPRSIFNAVIERVLKGNDQKFHSPHIDDFHDAWFAVGYRFFTCTEHDREFTASINRAGIDPPRLEHYIQERELFGFFISGLASLESFAYSCYALGAILDVNNFSTSNPRSITLKSTIDRFLRYYPGGSLTLRLDQLRNETEFKDWSDTRNILAHRLLPPRQITVTLFPPQPDLGKKVTWVNNKIQIDNSTTSSRRKWLAQALAELVSSADLFTKKYFQLSP